MGALGGSPVGGGGSAGSLRGTSETLSSVEVASASSAGSRTSPCVSVSVVCSMKLPNEAHASGCGTVEEHQGNNVASTFFVSVIAITCHTERKGAASSCNGMHMAEQNAWALSESWIQKV